MGRAAVTGAEAGRETATGSLAVTVAGLSRGVEMNDVAGEGSGRDDGIDAMAGDSTGAGSSRGLEGSARGEGGSTRGACGATAATGAGSTATGAGSTATGPGSGSTGGNVSGGSATSSTGGGMGGGGGGATAAISGTGLASTTGCGCAGVAGLAAAEPSAGSTNLVLIHTTAVSGGSICSQSPVFPTTWTLSPFVSVSTGL